MAALFSSKRVEFPHALVLDHPQLKGQNMVATLFVVDYFLIGFIAFAVLLALVFIVGVLLIIFVLPGRSAARRRRDRRNYRRRKLTEFVFDVLDRG